jgi:hypothetical protein
MKRATRIKEGSDVISLSHGFVVDDAVNGLTNVTLTVQQFTNTTFYLKAHFMKPEYNRLRLNAAELSLDSLLRNA